MICIDEEILNAIKQKGFNFSSMTNEFWEKYLSEPQKFEEIKAKIKQKHEEIEDKRAEIADLKKKLRKMKKNLQKPMKKIEQKEFKLTLEQINFIRGCKNWQDFLMGTRYNPFWEEIPSKIKIQAFKDIHGHL